MMALNKQHSTRLTRLVTPQAERNPGTRLLVRTPNAPVWPANEWERFDRFLIYGTERGTYFIRKRKLSVEQATNARARIVEDGPRAVRRIVELSVAGRVMTNETCLFALAMSVTFGNEATRVMALEAMPEVVRGDDEAATFTKYLEDLESMRGGTPDAAQGVQLGSGCEAAALLYAAASHTPRATSRSRGRRIIGVSRH